MNNQITRRQFVKFTAVGTASLAACSFLDFGTFIAAAEGTEPMFDINRRTVLLNNGIEMPIIGLGTFCLTRKQAENSTYWALKAGHRLIDTAYAYGNESGVGKGIQRALEEGFVKREEIFVTTKLWYEKGYNAEGIENALNKLGLDYIDLMLLHQPQGDYIGGYKAMEEALAQGKLHSIGVSNFSQAQMEKLMAATTVPPAVHQIETHLYNQQGPMTEYLNEKGIAFESWFPFGGRTNAAAFFAIPEVQEIAAAHDKKPAQVIIRWHLQNGHVCFPGSSNEEHIQENIDVFDFELTADEMTRLNALNRDTPYFEGMGDSEEEVRETAESWSTNWGLTID